MAQVSLYKNFIKGIWEENPTFRMLIGMCPPLAVTNSVINGFSMGVATLFVLVCSSAFISLLRKVIPAQVRLAAYVVIIATFVTMADFYLAGNFPEISKALGPYVPLIVVNCIILGRAEAFASKNPFHHSVADAVGMGLGFTWAMSYLGLVREVLGSGSILGFRILGSWFQPWLIMVLPPGAFFSLAISIGLMNHFTTKKFTAEHQH